MTTILHMHCLSCKLVNEGEGGENPQNPNNVVYEWPQSGIKLTTETVDVYSGRKKEQ